VDEEDSQNAAPIENICGSTAHSALAETADHMGIIDTLLDHGSDVNAQDQNGNTVLHLASQRFRVFQERKCFGHLLHNIINMRFGLVIAKMVDIGAPINVSNNEGVTPLMLAAMSQFGNLSPQDNVTADGDGISVHWLLEHNADATAKDANNRTALHYAAQAGDSTAVRFLLRAGASMTAPDQYHDTPLMLAAWFQSLPLAAMARHIETQSNKSLRAASKNADRRNKSSHGSANDSR
jgi:ankyrin repeat protein